MLIEWPGGHAAEARTSGLDTVILFAPVRKNGGLGFSGKHRPRPSFCVWGALRAPSFDAEGQTVIGLRPHRPPIGVDVITADQFSEVPAQAEPCRCCGTVRACVLVDAEPYPAVHGRASISGDSPRAALGFTSWCWHESQCCATGRASSGATRRCVKLPSPIRVSRDTRTRPGTRKLATPGPEVP